MIVGLIASVVGVGAGSRSPPVCRRCWRRSGSISRRRARSSRSARSSCRWWSGSASRGGLDRAGAQRGARSRRSRRCARRDDRVGHRRRLGSSRRRRCADRDRRSRRRLLVGLFATPSNAAVVVGLGAALTFVGVASSLRSSLARWRARSEAVSASERRATIGRQNAMRNPRRTASSAASALMIGLGLVAMMAILAASLKASFFAVLDATVEADLTISSPTRQPVLSRGGRARVASSPEVARRVGVRQAGFRVDGQEGFVTGHRSGGLREVVDLGVSKAHWRTSAATPSPCLGASRPRSGWAIGDEVPAAFPSAGGPTADDRGGVRRELASRATT